MPRGGKRKGAGRKATWLSGKTKAVKLPELLLPEIHKLVKAIDDSFKDSQIEAEDSTFTPLTDLDELIDTIYDSIYDSQAVEAIAKKLLARYPSLIKSVETNGQLLPSPDSDLGLPQVQCSQVGDEPSSKKQLRFSSSNFSSIISLTNGQACDAPCEGASFLTVGQLSALEKMKEFVRTDRQKYFRLTGYAGTGKSFLIVQLMKWLLNQKINFVGGSPTNKAVKNLKKLAAEAQVTIEAHTVAQLLGQQPELNEDTGVEEFISKGTDSIGSYTVALIDEFSMISKSNFKDINQAVWHTPSKVIFVGDAAQLPPVGESEPIIATHEYINHEATLNSVVRYDGDIARVAEEIRSDRAYNKFLYPFKTTSDSTITCLSRDEWLKCAIGFFKSTEYQSSPDHVRFLVWRNKTAASLNDYVRTQLWGEDAPDYVPGDRLIAKIPVFRRIPGAKGKNKWQIVMNNSEECEIVGSAQLKTSKPTKWEYWSVPARDANASPVVRDFFEVASRAKGKAFQSLLRKPGRVAPARRRTGRMPCDDDLRGCAALMMG